MARIQGKHFGQIIAAVGFFTLLYQFAFFTQEAQRLVSWIPAGEMNFNVAGDIEHGSPVLTSTRELTVIDGVTPTRGDTLVAIISSASAM